MSGCRRWIKGASVLICCSLLFVDCGKKELQESTEMTVISEETVMTEGHLIMIDAGHQKRETARKSPSGRELRKEKRRIDRYFADVDR